MNIDWDNPKELIDNLMNQSGVYMNCEICGGSLGYFEIKPDIEKHENLEDCIKYLKATKKDIGM